MRRRWAAFIAADLAILGALTVVMLRRAPSLPDRVRDTVAPEPAPPTVATPPSASPPPVAVAPSAGEPAAVRVPTDCPDYARELAAGRRATQEKRYDDARQSFTLALKAKPFSAEAWAEAGFAELLAGKDPHESLAIARSLTKTPALLSAAWFNEAEADAKGGDVEAARLKYALAARLGNGAAAKNLGGRSRCTVTWTKTVAPIPFLHGWREVLGAMPGATCGEERKRVAKTEAEAKREACRGCEGLMDPLEPPSETPCSGDGPWTIPNGHLSCHSFVVTIQSLGKGRFAFFVGFDAEVYRPTTFGFSMLRVSAASLEGEAVSAETMATGRRENGCPVDVSAEVALDMPVHCQMGEARPKLEGPRLLTSWDESGRGLLEVSAWGEVPEVRIAGGTAHLSGAGCDETVPLD